MNLLKNVKITKVHDSVAAGTDNKDSDIVDMAGFDGCLFILCMGTVTSGAVVELVADQNTANSTSGMAELEGSASFTAGASDSEKCVCLDVYRPTERYLRCGVEISTQNIEIDAVLAIQYQSSKGPITQSTDANGVIASETLISPDEA